MSIPPEETPSREAWEEAKKDKAERRRQNRDQWAKRRDWASEVGKPRPLITVTSCGIFSHLRPPPVSRRNLTISIHRRIGTSSPLCERRLGDRDHLGVELALGHAEQRRPNSSAARKVKSAIPAPRGSTTTIRRLGATIRPASALRGKRIARCLGTESLQALRWSGTVNLSVRLSRTQTIGSGHGKSIGNPRRIFLSPGSSMLGGIDMIAAEVEQVIDLIVG